MDAKDVTLEEAVRLLAEKAAKVASRAAKSRGEKVAKSEQDEAEHVAHHKAGRRGRPKKSDAVAGAKGAADVRSGLNCAGPEHAGLAASTYQNMNGTGSTTGTKKRGRPRKAAGAV